MFSAARFRLSTLSIAATETALVLSIVVLGGIGNWPSHTVIAVFCAANAATIHLIRAPPKRDFVRQTLFGCLAGATLLSAHLLYYFAGRIYYQDLPSPERRVLVSPDNLFEELFTLPLAYYFFYAGTVLISSIVGAGVSNAMGFLDGSTKPIEGGKVP